MTAEQAHFLANFLMADFEHEAKTTRRVLAAMPSGKESYTPDAKSMHALKLAWHIASADCWFVNSVAEGAFQHGEGQMPGNIKGAADVIGWYEENLPKAIARVRGMSGEDLLRPMALAPGMEAQSVVWLQLAVKHSVHHRGQLSAYLRPMGGKVPGIYGPSADDK